MQRYAAGSQQINLRKPNLKRVVTKNIGKHSIEPRLFPGKQVFAKRRSQP